MSRDINKDFREINKPISKRGDLWDLQEAENGEFFVGTVEEVQRNVGTYDQNLYLLEATKSPVEGLEGERVEKDVCVFGCKVLDEELQEYVGTDTTVVIEYQGVHSTRGYYKFNIYEEAEKHSKERSFWGALYRFVIGRVAKRG